MARERGHNLRKGSFIENAAKIYDIIVPTFQGASQPTFFVENDAYGIAGQYGSVL